MAYQWKLKIFKRIAFLAFWSILMSNHVIAQGSQRIVTMDSIFVTGYLVGDGKSVMFYATKDKVFDVAILKKKGNSEDFTKYIDPIDIKLFMGLNNYDTLKLINNPLKDIFGRIFQIRFKKKEYTVGYLNQYMLEVKAIGYKGEKMKFITFPFYK